MGGYLKYVDYDVDILQHLQNIELMILKEFIEFCDNNDLNYFIYGGSLLGAIRHKGFIPWDDDIDVIMFRKDYEKFKKLFLESNQDKYDLLTHETYSDYFFLFAKLMLKDTKFEEWWVDQVSFSVGINIDIFVLDYVSDNNIKCNYQTKTCRFLDRILTMSSIKLRDYPKLVQTFSNFTHIILKLFGVKPKTIIKHCSNLMMKYEDTGRVCDFSALHHPQIYNILDFNEGIKIPFEDIEVNAPENYHGILKQIYGDYMTLPPKDERYNHITQQLDFGPYENSK